MSHGIGLTPEEIHNAFQADGLLARYRPVLSPQAFAEMLGWSVDTVYLHLETGRLHGSHRRRGKRQLIWRDRALLLTFNGTEGRKFPFPRPRVAGPGIGLTDEEINKAFAGLSETYPPILGPEQLAELLQLSRSTIYFWTQQGHFAGGVKKQGKRQLFWRNRAVAALFNQPDWSDWDESIR